MYVVYFCFVFLLGLALGLKGSANGLAIGLTCTRVLNKKTKKNRRWEKEISKAGIGGAYIFSDGSLLQNGNVGGGAFVVGNDGREEEVKCGVEDVATVWGGELAGMTGGLAEMRREKKVLMLADSKAAITALRKAGRTGRARSETYRGWLTWLRRSKKGGRSSWGG